MTSKITKPNTKPYPINTWEIFNGEFGFWTDTSSERWPEYSLAYAQSFENLVIKNFKFNAPYKIMHSKEYDKFLSVNILSFYTREKPETPYDDSLKEEAEFINDQKNIVAIFSRLMLWTEDFIVLKENNDGDFFEVMFAFYLRQCKITKVYGFLEYQMEINFQNDKTSFLAFLKPLVNEYKDPLFFDALTQTIYDWIESQDIELYNDVVSSQPSTKELRSYELLEPKKE